MLGAALGAISPGLAGRTPPHPVLTGSLGDALGILQNNLRVLAAPYLLGVLGFPRNHVARRAGDLLILALTAGSTLPVGIELARWRARLLPYLPQLPVEWAALTVALSAWLLIRTTTAPRRQVAALAAVTVALLSVAASLETWCTPRPPARSALNQTANERAHRARLVGGGGGSRTGLCAADGHVAARSRAPFPSQCSVPLGRLGGADRCPINHHRPPQGGIERMNSVQLTGRLTAGVQTRTTNGGTQVASLRLAIQRPRKDGEDQGADYVDITVFGRQAETCVQYLAKGRKIAVEGRLHHSEWDSDTGRRQKLEVIANNVEFLDTPPRADTTDAPAQEAAA